MLMYFTSISEIKTRVINPDNAINSDKKEGQFMDRDFFYSFSLITFNILILYIDY